MRWSACLVMILIAVTAGCAQEWHSGLYLGNGDVWRQRIAVDVRNEGGQAAAGVPVNLLVGTGAGEAQLAEALLEAVRVCDASGTEMLFALAGPDGKLVKRGPIATGSKFTLPVECPAGKTARYFIYFDNPSAWQVQDTLDPGARAGAGAATLQASAAPPETLAMDEVGANAPWYAALPVQGSRNFRVAIPVVNVSSQDPGERLIAVYLTALRARLGLPVDWNSSLVVDDQGRPVISYRVGETLVFPAALPARTRRTYYLYFPATPQEPTGKAAAANAQRSYAAFLGSRYNLVHNPSFDSSGQLPDAWTFSAGAKPPAGCRGVADFPGLFGVSCVRTEAPQRLGGKQPGWLQTVPVQGEHSYLYAGWLKCQGVTASVDIGGECQTADGSSTGGRPSVTLSPPLSGDTDWTGVSQLLTLPEGCTQFEIRLTQEVPGTVWHDGLVLAEVQPTPSGTIEEQTAPNDARLTAWPVNAIIKVFQEARPPAQWPAARLTCARNEKEPLQVAVRSAAAVSEVQIEVTAPRQEGGALLPEPTIGVEGYVPVDYPSNSYGTRAPAWHRMFPTGTPASDGFVARWPDPILPRQRFALAANQTQPVWLTINVPENAAAGDYTGRVRFTHGGEVLAEMPFTVHVWNFALPTASHLKAIFGRRGKDAAWDVPGQTDQQRYEALWKLMAEYRLSPTLVEPEPNFRYEQGRCTVDFTEFDRAADYYFNTLKLSHAFTPSVFHGFDWGFPPGAKFGQRPYEGADRSRLRPEYKAAYQACLRVFLEHLKEKGWYGKFVMYMAGEPHYWNKEVRTQFTTLADMVHEVDPNLPIYANTMKYSRELNDSVNIWGLWHYGAVSKKLMREIQAGGAKLWWATSGQMCLDTPYCAIERLLPYYCFQYDAEAYEYYAIDVLLGDDPYQFGWHHFFRGGLKPGDVGGYRRVHDGGGYLLYPGLPPDRPGPVPTIRLEQVREGLEDYEYLYLLRSLLATHGPAGADAEAATQALSQATNLAPIPNATGLESTKILPQPEAVLQAKEALGAAIEALMK